MQITQNINCPFFFCKQKLVCIQFKNLLGGKLTYKSQGQADKVLSLAQLQLYGSPG